MYNLLSDKLESMEILTPEGINDKPEGLRILQIFFAFVDFQSIFQWKYPGGIKWKLLHTKKPAFYKGMHILKKTISYKLQKSNGK